MKLKIGNATIEHMRKHENCKGLKDSSTGVLIVAPISTLEDCNKSIYNIEIWLYNTNNQTETLVVLLSPLMNYGKRFPPRDLCLHNNMYS